MDSDLRRLLQGDDALMTSFLDTTPPRAPEGYAAEYSGKDLSVKLQFDHRLTGWIDGEAVENGFRLAAGNLPGVNVLPAVGANVYDILKHDTLVLTRSAVEKLEARFNG